MRYLLKQARREAGVARDVQIAHDSTTAWYSVASGPISVHCMSRDIREQLNLEGLWGERANTAWYQRGPSAMTLDSIRVPEGDAEPAADEALQADAGEGAGEARGPLAAPDAAPQAAAGAPAAERGGRK